MSVICAEGKAERKENKEPKKTGKEKTEK